MIKKEILGKIEAFQNEKYKFNLFYRMAESNDCLVHTDKETYIVAREKKGYPAWIWTINDISKEKQEELEEVLVKHYINDSNSFTCKEEIYDKLLVKYNKEKYFEMGFLKLEKLNPITKAHGFKDRPNNSDVTTLAKFWQGICEDTNDEEVNFTEALVEAEEWIRSNDFYVWRNNQGKAVAVANFTVWEDQARISYVYTDKEERKKGYCKSLIYEIVKIIQSKKLVPLLYTNHNEIIVNKTYEKLGFVQEGVLVKFLINEYDI